MQWAEGNQVQREEKHSSVGQCDFCPFPFGPPQPRYIKKQTNKKNPPGASISPALKLG